MGTARQDKENVAQETLMHSTIGNYKGLHLLTCLVLDCKHCQ